MKPLTGQAKSLLARIGAATTQLGLEADSVRLKYLEGQMVQSDFWADPAEAEKISREAAQLKDYLGNWQSLDDELKLLIELAEISDDSQLTEFESKLADLMQRAETSLIAVKLSGKYDKLPAIVQISAGVGGTDAQDWAEMLLTMYTRYAEKAGLSAELIDISRGEEAGIKSATLEIRGSFALGKLKGEKGVHRLVRLSPFNSDSLRQTSFALVDVVPEIPMEDIELDAKDLRIDVFRSGGHGGQSVNTTDSAVRITHLPTGIVVSIQNERSQLKNKAKAMSILASRLADLAHEQHLDSIAELRGKVQSADWGQQIRSYVLHPYKKVKDHRTDYETSDTDGVLGGEIEPFIEAYLTKQLGQ